MESTPKEEMKSFTDKTSLMDRQGVYYLQTQARQLGHLMDKYKKQHTQMIVHKFKPQLDDLINDEIKTAIDAHNKNLKSKGEKLNIARSKYFEIECGFFALFTENPVEK